MLHVRHVAASVFLCLIGGVAVSRSSDLTGLLVSRARQQDALRTRKDCNNWYEFAPVPEGLTLEAGRQHGVTIKNGETVMIAGCTVRNIRNAGRS